MCAQKCVWSYTLAKNKAKNSTFQIAYQIEKSNQWNGKSTSPNVFKNEGVHVISSLIAKKYKYV